MYLNVDIGTFNQSLVIRDSRECASGQKWYVCTANNFRGCCSVDACSVSECPDSSTAAVGASSSSTTSSKSSSSTSTETTSSSATSTTSSQTTESSQITLQTPSPSTILLTTTVSHSVITTHTPSSSPTILAESTSQPASSNSTPIIAGAIVGGIALICFAMAAFCCFRFRQKKKQDRERMFAESESPDPETIQFYTTTGKTLQTPSSTRTSRSPSGGFSGLGGLGLGDVFASFSRKTRSSSTSPPSTSPPGGPSMTESQISAPIHLMHPMHIVHPTPIPESPEDHEHDKPLSSDPEKSSITPPPESLHPAFHVLPGTSSRPAYRPGLGFTINELDGRETGRRSGSIGGSIGARSEGMSMSGSEGIVSPMSTPNTNERVSSKGFSAMGTPPFNLIAPASSMNIPQGYGHEHGHGHGQVQGTWHSNTAPNNLPPNGPAPIQSQFNTQSYHRRNNSSTNNSNSGSSSPNPYTINQPQAQAQTQYAQQLAQARRTNATIVENPYQMYRDSREHQQNMGYQNALERAQAQDQGRSQGQVQSRVQRQMPAQKGKERERVSEGTDKNGQENEEGSGLKREISTHSIPIGLSLDAQPSASHPNPQKRNRETNPRDQNAQLQVHATLYGNHGGLPEPLHRRTQTQPSYIRTHTHSGSGSHSRSGPGPGSVSSIGNSASSPSPNPNPNHMRSMSSTKQWNHRIPVIGSGSGSENGKQQPGFTAPGFDFECRVVAPTPP